MLKRIKSSIFLKMFLSIFSILTLASLSIYAIAMVATPQSYQAQSEERFSSRIQKLAEQLETVARRDADQILIDFCIANQVAVSMKGGNDSLAYGDLAALQQGGAQGNGVAFGVSISLQFVDGETIYTLTAVPAGEEINEMTAAFWRQLPWILLTVLLISMLGSLVCSRLLAKPVLEISRISKRMSRLDMTWRCDINRTDELGVLANSLNTMAHRLNAAMAELAAANRQLHADIEKERKQEKQRRAFFAAVSHELKTPITILKGQIESMILGIGDYKNKEKYLPSALETVERMENLVKEILTISKLTSDDFKLSMHAVDVSKLVRNCMDLYEPLALKKHMTLDIRILQDVTLQVDRGLFKKALSNIVSNAILYSPERETVTVSLTADALTVENTGVRIPPEKLADLFVPLTRVEESRNKNTGGSGLGLYIVKTILDLHGLPCEIQNSENGVRFQIYFDRNQNQTKSNR